MTSKLSTRLLLLRRDLHLNQEDLAAKSGISRPYISDLERGRITNAGVEVVEALASALQIEPAYLAGWSDDPSGESTSASILDGRIVYQVANPREYRRIQELLDRFNDLAPEYQEIVLTVIEEFRRAQRVRIVGGEP